MHHDLNLADGVIGMNSFAAEIASSPAADITIFRTLVDGDLVLLHSRYDGLNNASAPLLAMDLSRFKDDKIVEHWGGQEPESSDRNLGGHTQVDGPTAIEDRPKTEANRALIQTYRDIVTVQQHYDRFDDFLDYNYTQHAVGLGDGIDRVKARYAVDVKPGTSQVLNPRLFVADGNFVLSGRCSDRPAQGELRPVSDRKRQDRRALGGAVTHTSAGSMEELERTVLATRLSKRRQA